MKSFSNERNKGRDMFLPADCKKLTLNTASQSNLNALGSHLSIF